MAVFEREAAMQAWLSSELAKASGLSDLIINIDDFEDVTPKNFAEQRLLASIRTCIESLGITEVFSENENISISDSEILKPDFVLYAPETESIVIVELKNFSGASREAGTELSAYAGEIRTSIPFIADGDIVYVIVSAEWPTLLKHYVRQEIFWQHRNLICLRPIAEGESVKLEILGLDELSEGDPTFKISVQHLGGYQICLYDDELYGKGADRARLDQYETQFRTALQAMATTGNRLNSHGFAVLWKDHAEFSLAPYSITVMNLAPFQSVERFLHIENEEIPVIIKRFMSLVKEYGPEGHGNALELVTRAAESFLKKVCSPQVEGFTHWGEHQHIMSGRAENLAFVGWGLFGEALFARLQEEYEAGNTACSATAPHLGLSVVSEIVDNTYEFVDLTYIDFGDEGDEGDPVSAVP